MDDTMILSFLSFFFFELYRSVINIKHNESIGFSYQQNRAIYNLVSNKKYIYIYMYWI